MNSEINLKFFHIDESDKVIASAITFHLVLMTCKNSLVATSKIFFDINIVLNIVCWLSIFFNYARVFLFKNIASKIPLPSYMILALLSLFCLISHIVDSNLFFSSDFPYNYVQKSLIDFLSYSLPVFLFTSALENPTYLLECFFSKRWILFAFGIIGFVFFTFSSGQNFDYSMSFGTSLLFSIFLFFFSFYKTNDKLDCFAGILLVVCLVLCGSRGPLISIAVLSMFFALTRTKSLKSYILLVPCCVCLCVLFLFKETLLPSIVSLLENFGIRSRTLHMMLVGSISYDSGRSTYFNHVFEALNESPVLGLGAFGGNRVVGITHNLYLDIWANFGYFVGSILMLCLLYNLVKIAKGEPSFRNPILFYSIMMFPRGGSAYEFWGSKELWILFGLIVSYYSRLEPTRSSCENDNYPGLGYGGLAYA